MKTLRGTRRTEDFHRQCVQKIISGRENETVAQHCTKSRNLAQEILGEAARAIIKRQAVSNSLRTKREKGIRGAFRGLRNRTRFRGKILNQSLSRDAQGGHNRHREVSVLGVELRRELSVVGYRGGSRGNNNTNPKESVLGDQGTRQVVK